MLLASIIDAGSDFECDVQCLIEVATNGDHCLSGQNLDVVSEDKLYVCVDGGIAVSLLPPKLHCRKHIPLSWQENLDVVFKDEQHVCNSSIAISLLCPKQRCKPPILVDFNEVERPSQRAWWSNLLQDPSLAYQ